MFNWAVNSFASMARKEMNSEWYQTLKWSMFGLRTPKCSTRCYWVYGHIEPSQCAPRVIEPLDVFDRTLAFKLRGPMSPSRYEWLFFQDSDSEIKSETREHSRIPPHSYLSSRPRIFDFNGSELSTYSKNICCDYLPLKLEILSNSF